jgi:preprotein translocase subunit SecD
MNSGNVNYRLAALAAITLAALVYLSPVFLPDGARLPFGPAENPIHLGLDLRGGTHLLFTVDVDDAVSSSLDRTRDDVARAVAEEEIPVDSFVRKGDSLVLTLGESGERSTVETLLTNGYPGLVLDSVSGQVLTLSQSRRQIEQIKRLAIDQSLETIRNRIDQFGVAEPTIQRQGSTEIVVQLPGVQDPQRAKDLIGKTAVLEFRLIADGTSKEVETLTSSNLASPGSPTTWEVEKRVLLSGVQLADARVRPAAQFEGPQVELTMTDTGAVDLESASGDNVGRRLAIILDDKVVMAPSLNERIGGGRAVISGNFDLTTARDLAIVLRAGALPAPIHIIEERTVGPSLGRDSIEQGVLSLMVGGFLVILFMAYYYRGAGILADTALLLNVVFLMAVLAGFGATLTLPGIAGIVLTMGMAVDANVLINERIREELRLGKTPRAAVEAGYERAWAAIRDSNITTFVSGIILFQFGSGPVKGFAVTLCVGIVTTVVTAVFATRIYYDFRLERRNLKTISI